ncbi:MAG TPA: penicillin-binding protein 1A [Chromatiales bacterium]|nr:penicillin-binding protein 1A [Chromatiales bacterium]
MKWLIRLIKFLFFSMILGVIVAGGAALGIYLYLEPKLPSIEALRDVRLQVPLRIYSRDEKLIAEYGEKRRIPLHYGEIPERMVQAFLAAEDDRFFEHPGVDYQGLLRAARELAFTGKRRQGGSTITMQVARNFFLTKEKTFERKFNEILLALRIEKELTKEQVLELYLNKIYLGHRAYGVGAAAQVYYGKAVDQLDLPQTAMIAGLPKAPSRYNPIADPDRALQRRDYVLGRMAELGVISQEEYRQARQAPVTAQVHKADVQVEAPYVAEMVRADMVERYGNESYIAGYQVYTTLDSQLQEAANRALRNALHAYDKRHGYRGPVRHVELAESKEAPFDRWDEILSTHAAVADLKPALVVATKGKTAKAYMGEGSVVDLGWQGLSWARPYIDESRQGPPPENAAQVVTPGDLIYLIEEKDKKGTAYWRLAEVPQVEGALVALDPLDGAVRALVGGFDYYRSKFNRVMQAKRQPGSGFKAFIYSAALEAGYTPATLINDAPVVFDDPSLETTWRPENYSGRFFGQTRLRMALTKSRNLVSIRLLRSMGIQHALQHIKRFGFNINELPKDLSLALGSGAVTPTSMAEGYAVLANGGYHVEPYTISRILDRHGEALFTAKPLRVCSGNELQVFDPADEGKTGSSSTLRCAEPVISPQNHYLMNSMMQDVVQHGTATRAKVLGRHDLAGKTGTTNEQRDAWFNGFHPSIVAVAWVGFDSTKPLGKGEVGGRAALPAWIDFMRVALKDVPEADLPLPEGMITVRIDPQTGERARAGQKNAIFETFRIDNVPELEAEGPVSFTSGNMTKRFDTEPEDEDLF